MVLDSLDQVQKVFEKLLSGTELTLPSYFCCHYVRVYQTGTSVQVFVKNLSFSFVLNVVIGNDTIENKSVDSECKVPVYCW